MFQYGIIEDLHSDAIEHTYVNYHFHELLSRSEAYYKFSVDGLLNILPILACSSWHLTLF
jgi:hypothetical protein